MNTQPILLTPELHENHKELKNQFIEISNGITTENADDETNEDLMQVLTAYSNLFKCSVAKAYSRIKFDTVLRDPDPKKYEVIG